LYGYAVPWGQGQRTKDKGQSSKDKACLPQAGTKDKVQRIKFKEQSKNVKN